MSYKGIYVCDSCGVATVKACQLYAFTVPGGDTRHLCPVCASTVVLPDLPEVTPPIHFTPIAEKPHN